MQFFYFSAMFLRLLCLLLFVFLSSIVFAQKTYTVVNELRDEWQIVEGGAFKSVAEGTITGMNTIYVDLNPAAYESALLHIKSSRTYFLFINGKIRGEFTGEQLFPMDTIASWSLAGRSLRLAIHQDRINVRDLETQIISYTLPSKEELLKVTAKPYSYFRDFSVLAALLLIILFVASLRLNPKLAGDYFSVQRLFSSRETDDAQASARLTSGANVQFYVLCSLMISYYLMILLHNLPPRFALPIYFEATGFGMIWLQWLKLSLIVFAVFLVKLLVIFLLTRLFGMRGMARYHFFNWVRLLLVMYSLAAFILFMYFISRGSNEQLFVTFLWVVIVALVMWIGVAFLKLAGRSGHSMFHLFSYLCATEIIPLLITAKVLFQ